MRLPFLLVVIAEVFDRQTACHAFSLFRVLSRHRRTGWRPCLSSSLGVLSASSAAPTEESTMDQQDPGRAQKKKPLTPKEILERQRKRQGLTGGDDDDVYPKLFEDDLLNNIQQILLTLEKRVKEGPGSLTQLDVEEFVTISQSVMTEMKEKEYSRLRDADAASTTSHSSTMTANPQAVSSTTTVEAAPVVPDVASQVEILKSKELTESEDLEDGPAYSAAGGNGSLAKGTVNTYIIPNMDEMSPEEYQKALQESITARQKQRIASGQQYGNRATWDYLNNLSGDSGVLKATKSEGQD